MRNRFFAALPNPLQAISSCVSSIQGCASKVWNSRIPRIGACVVLVTSAQILQFICKERMTKDSVDWTYFSETQSRIWWLAISSLLQGLNLESVIKTIQDDISTENEQINYSNKLSALALTTGCTTYLAGMNFAEYALTIPLNMSNAGMIAGHAGLQGVLFGPLMMQGYYVLRKLDYSLHPMTKSYVKWLGAGVVFKMVQEVLDYACTQMIKNNKLAWDDLVGSERLVAWHILNSVLPGVIYGVSIIGLKKYAIESYEMPDDVRSLLVKTRDRALMILPVATSITSFIDLSLKSPLNHENAMYISIDSLIGGIPVGFVSASNLSVFMLLGLCKYSNGSIARLVESQDEMADAYTSIENELREGKGDLQGESKQIESKQIESKQIEGKQVQNEQAIRRPLLAGIIVVPQDAEKPEVSDGDRQLVLQR